MWNWNGEILVCFRNNAIEIEFGFLSGGGNEENWQDLAFLANNMWLMQWNKGFIYISQIAT